MKQPARLLAALAAGALLAAPGVAQQLYKYVDKDGRVQYSDRPPAGGQKAEKVTGSRVGTVSGGTSTAAAAAGDAAKASGPKTPAELEQDFRKRQSDAADKARKDEKLAEDRRAQDESCAEARRQLAGLQAGGRAARLNEQGERIFLDDDAIRQETERYQREIANSCR